MRRSLPFFTALFAAVLVLGGADGCSSDPDVEGAKLYVRQEDYAQALTRLQAALATNPDNVAALELQTEVYRLQAERENDATARRPMVEGIVTAADRVRTIAPDNAEVPRTRLRAWINEMQKGGADLQAAGTEPTRVPNAIAAFENATRLAPDSASAHYNLGLAYLVSGQTAQAIPHMEEAVRLGVHDENAYVYLGRAYVAASRGADAVTLLERGRTEFPQSQDVQAELLNAYAATGQSDRALGAYQDPIFNDQDNAVLYYNYGSVLLQAERYDEAIPQLTRATELDPSNASAFYNLGAAYQNQAAAIQNQMRELDANDTATYDRLRGQRDDLLRQARPAFEGARRATQAAGDDPADVCRALFRVYTTLGMTAESQEAGQCAGEDMN